MKVIIKGLDGRLLYANEPISIAESEKSLCEKIYSF